MSIEKPYACIFAISRSCSIESKAFDRSMSTRETNLSLCQMIVSNFQLLYSWKDVVSTIFFPVSRNEVGEEGTDIRTQALREKCPNTELFLARVFPHSDWIHSD